MKSMTAYMVFGDKMGKSDPYVFNKYINIINTTITNKKWKNIGIFWL